MRNCLYIVVVLCLLSGCVYGQSKIRYFVIGDTLPDIKIKKIINSHTAFGSTRELKGKALILDFWAPWCAPCLSVMPKVDSIQRKYAQQLNIVGVTRDNELYATKSLQSLSSHRNIRPMISIVEDTVLSKLSNHMVIPNYIWIDKNGMIMAITGSEELTDQNVAKLVKGDPLNLPRKYDYGRKFNYDQPIFAGNMNVGKSELIYQSTLTRYIQNLHSEAASENNWIRLTNCSINQLFTFAFSEWDLSFLGGGRLVLEGFNTTKDSLEIGIYSESSLPEWRSIKNLHFYNYELVIDSALSRAEKFKLFKEDLNRYFGAYGMQGSKERRSSKTLTLVRTSQQDKIKSKGGDRVDAHSQYYLNMKNRHISWFILKLTGFYRKIGAIPIEDETNYSDMVDIEINANLSDIDAVNKELEKYDLKLVEKEKSIEVVVIRKMNSNKSK